MGSSLTIAFSILLLCQADIRKPGPHIPFEVPLQKPGSPSRDTLKELPVEPIAAGKFRIETVILDQKEKTLSFPGTLNMTNGVVEYAIVSINGKVHESILRTETQPYAIHLGMLLLGANATNVPGTSSAEAKVQSGQIEVPSAIEPAGEKIAIELRWQQDGKEINRPLSELVFNSRREKPLSGEPWVYNGSRFGQGRFLAQLSGSIVSLITDLDALVNSTSPGHDDDDIWQVNPKTIPPPRVPIDIILRLSKKP